ncbi:DUF1918 domain-containing protein [Planctomonas sp. JC2975]|uniref:DUF1918 domain-containing protein n=1 Tax=Planctomonas sp. JC2975 TaxID=2729626 RepID=UPI0014745014|nr:DUF1918 domain-containing protein [Planctomonas sp. JC2975]NNC13972.1 DUF1918 domain-containing protein [Planctomonas sp. JC2975]
MRAEAGERIVIRGMTVETPDRHGEIVEVRGENGAPPYLVRFDDGHETLVYPGADATVEHPQ